MRVLIACECSGIIRDAFAVRGHDAWSCDLKPGESPGQHIRGDVIEVIEREGWDMMIAHPPCTHLAVSGARWWTDKKREQQEAIAFFMVLAKAAVLRICIENPVGFMSTVWRAPDQYVQPYDFGDDASKKTGLWLKGLPKLVADPGDYVAPRMVGGKTRWANQCDSGQNRLGPSPERAALRARTYPGIARAMAEQWGGL